MRFPESVDEAYARIKTYIRKTPAEPAFTFYEESRRVHFKLECLQHTRSFKVRGALNKLLALSSAEKNRGIVTASTGNHAMAVTHGLKQLGFSGTIYLPETVAQRKLNLLERQGARLEFFGTDSAYTEKYARKQAEERGQVYISPYNDPHIVAGQGTVGIELLEQLPELDTVFVPVGGGGLISGIGGYLKSKKPSVRVVGCLPENSPVMLESINAGKIVDGTVRPTLSDGTAGGMEDDAITFDLCRQFVDEWVLVSEEEIRAGMQMLFNEYSLVVEGAAGVSIASYMKYAQEHPSATMHDIAIILCGGNVDIEQFKKLVF